MKNIILTIFILFSTVVIAEDNDPFEGVNRTIFDFNTALDKSIIEPIAVSYKENTPQNVQNGVSNFFSNLKEAPTFANQILQFKLTNAIDTAMRFIVNSTIGLAGIVDVATEMGWKKHNEDFGQTLGFYGIESGPYLVLPLLGPSNLRDMTTLIVDPMAQVNLNLTSKESLAKILIFGLDIRTKLLPQTSVMYQSDDPYIFTRSSYLQDRDYQINDGKTVLKDIDF